MLVKSLLNKSMSANSYIELHHVTVRYQQKFEPAVQDVSFEVDKGQIAMIIGPNGSGKSTLIKAMLGLIPYEGDITLRGRDIEKASHAVGYVPQTHTVDLSFPLTVQEFLSFSHANCPDTVNRPKHIHNTLAKIHAENLMTKSLRDLSGGQLQRILLARAIMHQPKVLILDEPETGIDVGTEATLYDLIVQLKEKENVTSIIATHEIDTVKKYADQVICINHCLVCSAPPKEALTEEIIKSLYGHHTHH